MCDYSASDPRDVAHTATRALSGLRSILQENPSGVVCRADLAVLLELISDQLQPATDALLHYVPRDWKPGGS